MLKPYNKEKAGGGRCQDISGRGALGVSSTEGRRSLIGCHSCSHSQALQALLPTSTLLFEVHRMNTRSFEALSFVACHLNCSVCLEIFVMLIRPFETFIWTFILHKNLIPWYLCANVDLFQKGIPNIVFAIGLKANWFVLGLPIQGRE